MRYKLAALVLVVMVLAAGCIGGGSRATTNPSAQINARLDSLGKAWESGNTSSFANQFSYPMILNGGVVDSAEEMRAIAEINFSIADIVHSVKFTNRRITLDGNRAVIRTTIVADLTVLGVRETDQSEVILEARGTSWKFSQYALVD